MSKIVAICNQKGGTGKTTTAVNLSASLALLGKRTLLIDIDPQGNATSGCGIDKDTIKSGIYDLVLEKHPAKNTIIPTQIPKLSLIPSNVDLTGAEVELVGAIGREYKLKKSLKDIRNDFEYIFIDCPPSLGLLTVNALSAASGVLIPAQCEYYALEGLSLLLNTINLVRDNLNPMLQIEGVVLTMADFRTNLTREVINEAKNFFKDKVYKTIIPRNIKLTEAPSFGKPIELYDKNSIGAQAYQHLAAEFLKMPVDDLATLREEDIVSEQAQEEQVAEEHYLKNRLENQSKEQKENTQVIENKEFTN